MFFTAIALLALAADPSPDDAKAALHKATQYMHGTIAAHGGYAWVSSVDGKLRNGEGACGPGTIWIQPPGTPAVGMAFLDAYEATNDPVHLKAANDVAKALTRGQLRSGGWHYSVEFDPAKRRNFIYRDQGLQHPDTPSPGGWDIWRQRKYQADTTILDDDTSPAVLRFLLRHHQLTKGSDKAATDALNYALDSVVKAQYPIGAWSHNYDRFPTLSPVEAHYPIRKASEPKNYSRLWTKDFTGCYMLNDRITQNLITTMLLAHRVLGEERYLTSANKAGKFLLLAQLPEPQPAWAQQYNREMVPVWDRKFEPPAITGFESQDVLEALLMLVRETGDRQYLEPIPRAVSYLQKSRLSDGKVARFYEFGTNKPLYFTKDYRITYDPAASPTHYGFQFPSRLDEIQKEYGRIEAVKDGRYDRPKEPVNLDQVAKILKSQDASGGWKAPGQVRDAQGRKQEPAEGVVFSQTFIDNVEVLSRFVKN